MTLTELVKLPSAVFPTNVLFLKLTIWGVPPETSRRPCVLQAMVEFVTSATEVLAALMAAA